MDFREVLSAIFSKTDWKKVTETEKYSYFFVLNRMLSIRHPQEINSCQIIGLGKQNSARMLDCWNVILSHKYTRIPAWVYTKSGTKGKTADVTKDISKDTVAYFVDMYELGTQDFSFLCSSSPAETRKELLKLEKSLVER